MNQRYENFYLILLAWVGLCECVKRNVRYEGEV